MKVEPFDRADIPAFLCLADGEKWVAEAWELEFLLGAFPEGCLVVRDGQGNAVSFVTSLKHDQSGWIGNLIVAEKYRRQGIGEQLFAGALLALQGACVETVWLTASKMGVGLYEKHGFTSIDTIIRWVGTGSSQPGREEFGVVTETAPAEAVCNDAVAWGDCRELLLSTVMGRGESWHGKDGFATVQTCCGRFQLGPFVARSGRYAEELLTAVLRMVPKGASLYLDAPASNHSALLLFKRTNFRIAGTSELMYFGKPPAYRPERIYGLATMGSCG